ncbi:O-antigen ligase [Pseudactinotalea sp. HY158]|uniref:O-antigen ligase family protein n=1 Tax=Pseudactinotalea sp. HY158 TaxID=2654547 RepID=UPI00129CAB3C|nr:O-antigen ligase family protein [Pseudactinotalea sp. HY158]QGH68487.1 O-antigen ligase domain-containing protein [Pseudactinotalea sp. HY158]
MSRSGRAPTSTLPRAASRDEWDPALLRTPTVLRRLRTHWIPLLLRRRQVTVLGLLVAFLALQFLIPSRLVIGGMGAVGRPSVAVGVMIAFLWCLCAVRPHRLPGGVTPIRLVLGLFVALQLFGYAVGVDRGPTAGELSAANMWLIFIVAMAGVALAAADGLHDRRDVDRLLQTLVAVAAAMAVVGVLQFTGIVDLTRYIRIPGLHLNADLIAVGARGDGHFPRVAGTANHYIEFGVVLAIVLPIALHYALFSPRGRTRAWRWVAVGLIASGIPLSISRSAILTVVMTMGLLAVVWPWRHRYNAAVVAVLATAAFHVVNRGVLGTIKGLFLNVDDDPSVLDRIARTGYVIDLWSRRPWLGRGAGMITPERYILLDNQLYMTLLAGGVIGLTGFVLLFLVPYLQARSIRLRARDQETRHLGQALAVTLPAAFMASGTFDSFSFSTFVGTMFVVFGTIAALHRVEGISVHTPLQPAAPGDRYVATPVMADIRARLRAGWSGGALLRRPPAPSDAAPAGPPLGSPTGRDAMPQAPPARE